MADLSKRIENSRRLRYGGAMDDVSTEIKPIYDVKMNGPDQRVKDGYKTFIARQVASQGDPLSAGEITHEELKQAAQNNMGYAFNKGYLEPLADPTTPAAVKKSIADAMADRAYGKAAENVNHKLSGSIGVVTISGEDIARLIDFANKRAAAGDEALVVSE